MSLVEFLFFNIMRFWNENLDGGATKENGTVKGHLWYGKQYIIGDKGLERQSMISTSLCGKGETRKFVMKYQSYALFFRIKKSPKWKRPFSDIG